MGQIYRGTLVIQTENSDSPTGNYFLRPVKALATSSEVLKGYKAYGEKGEVLDGSAEAGSGFDNPIIAQTEAEMESLNIVKYNGKVVLYVGETGKYEKDSYYVVVEG